VSSGTLNPTHSLTVHMSEYSVQVFDCGHCFLLTVMLANVETNFAVGAIAVLFGNMGNNLVVGNIAIS